MNPWIDLANPYMVGVSGYSNREAALSAFIPQQKLKLQQDADWM